MNTLTDSTPNLFNQVILGSPAGVFDFNGNQKITESILNVLNVSYSFNYK